MDLVGQVGVTMMAATTFSLEPALKDLGDVPVDVEIGGQALLTLSL